MRLTKGLLIVLIGMIFTTAFANTSEPAQKQQTIFVAPEYQATNLAIVPTTIQEQILSLVFIQVKDLALYEPAQAKIFITNKDVGWREEKTTRRITNKIAACALCKASNQRNARDAISCPGNPSKHCNSCC